MRRPLLLATLLAVLALTPAAASGADSHAPAAARADWLPPSEWVMSSWLPFDEARLYDVLDTDRAELAGWLNDRRTLGAFAAKRGHASRPELVETLLAPRMRGASATTKRRLRARAMDMLTQAHLARHVLFHIFHTPAIPRHAQEIFGMTPRAYRTLRDSGWTPVAIAAKGGMPAQRSADALRSILVRRGDQAVRAGAMSRRQADTLLALQDAGLPGYMARHYRTTAQQATFACSLH
jgi:hypothetical protein